LNSGPGGAPDLRDGRAEPRGHVYADRQSRQGKARKIEFLLGGKEAIRGKDLLDLGSGAGLISEYFAGQGARVTAADRDPGMFGVDGIECSRIDGAALPFEDSSFDIVVFNHVIEHVGDRPAQRAMLVEIDRCLRPGGVLYLAVPNKWALIEPHYRLPLLGALPRGIADALVRRFRHQPDYDCYPFARGELLALVRERFRSVRDVSAEAFAFAVEHELKGPLRSLLGAVPQRVVSAARGMFPTLIVIAYKSDEQGHEG